MHANCSKIIREGILLALSICLYELYVTGELFYKKQKPWTYKKILTDKFQVCLINFFSFQSGTTLLLLRFNKSFSTQ